MTYTTFREPSTVRRCAVLIGRFVIHAIVRGTFVSRYSLMSVGRFFETLDRRRRKMRKIAQADSRGPFDLPTHRPRQ